MKINTLNITKVPETPTDRPPKWVNLNNIRDAGGYCWNHGYCVDINHNSLPSQSNNGGHQDDVTRADNKSSISTVSRGTEDTRGLGKQLE